MTIALPGLRRTALLAVGCNAVLEVAQLTGFDGHPWSYKTPAYALLFLLGALVLWALVGLVHAVVGRFWLTGTVMVTVTLVVAVAQHEKMQLRREPVYPEDWVFAGDPRFLAGMVRPRTLVLAAAVLVVAVAGLAVLLKRHVRHPPMRPLVRVASGALCLLVLASLVPFHSPGNPAHAAYDALGASWRPWSQQRNYLGNGFVGGTLDNLEVPPMPPPPGYSRATMRRVAARYAADARAVDRTRDPGVLDRVNVVLVLSESFSDPTALRGVHLDEDPIPFVRGLMRRTTSGSMLAQNVGGGTANMEFEALTGMSASGFPAQMRVPYQMVVPGRDGFPSVVGWLRGRGHRAVAIHPFTTEMYRRREVYQAFGFDDFVHDTTMRDQQRIGHDAYLSDAAAFDEVRRQLAGSARPMLLNVVTMQNHIPYAGRYDDPVGVTGPHGERLDDIGQYARGLSHTDTAVRGLLGSLRRLGEPTVVVFYGDHLPAGYPEDVFAANGPRAMRRTPFFVWSTEPGRARAQPLTSPTHFVDLALDRVGAALPPYYVLLRELRQQLPAMEGGALVGADGRPRTPGTLTPRAARLLRDYRLVQYDLSVGHRYGERALFAR